MKAAQINKYGGDEVVEVKEIPKPIPRDNEIVVEIHAAGVNPIDWKIRGGHVAKWMPVNFPATLGGDFSGVVSETKPGSGYKVGDEVYGQAIVLGGGGSGSFAECASASLETVAKKPKNVSHIEAAALPLAGVSALQAITEHLKLAHGQRIIVHGGAGGIGSFAIQIAKHIGAFAYATASAADKEYVKKLGADTVIDYKTEKFEGIAKECDAVFDTVGGETYRRSFAVLKKGGTIVSMLEQPDKELMKKYGVTAISQFTKITTERLNKLTALVESGAIKIRVDKIFPLSKTAEALRHLETGHPKGKVVIKMR